MRYTKQIYWTIVCCSLFLFLQHGYKYHFYYLEQLQLFLFSGRYASDTILQPGGLSLYVSRFLVQFQLLPFAGALIHALLLTATGILTQKFLKQTAPEPATYLISLLPTGMLLLLHLDANYKLQGTVAFLLMLIALLLYTRISSPVRRSILGTILTLLLYYIAGPVASLFAGMAILQDFLHKKPKPALSLIYLPAFLIPGLITLFSGGEGTCRMIFLPLAYYDPLLRSITIYFAWIALPVCLLLAYFLRKTAETSFSKKQLIVLFAQLIPLYFFFIWILHKDNRAFLENMQQDYYLRTEQWDKIISEFPGENKSNMQTMNVLNLALAQKGALGDRLFDYKQLGHKTLLDSWDSATPSAIALCDIYYHIGDIAAAQKLAFEGMVASINDGNVRLLKRLIETNLIFGEYPVAGKYIALLEQTLLYRKEASEYRRFLENDEAVEKDAILGGKRKGLINGKQYAVSNFTPKTLEMLAVNNPANQLPMQYLLAICLTNKDLKHFRTLLEKYLRTDVLPALSKSHQEAVIAMEQHNPGFWIKNGVSTKTEQQFRAFDFDMGSPQVPNFKEKMESSHGDTYWYYVLFTNIKAIQSNETVNPYNADYQPRLLQNRGGGG